MSVKVMDLPSPSHRGAPDSRPFCLSALDPEESIMYITYNMMITYSGGSMAHLPVTKAREELSDMINRVVYRGERVVLERRGKDVAALVPIEDLKRIEELEDRLDAAALKKARSEARRRGQRPIPWSRAKKNLGL